MTVSLRQSSGQFTKLCIKKVKQVAKKPRGEHLKNDDVFTLFHLYYNEACSAHMMVAKHLVCISLLMHTYLARSTFMRWGKEL